MVHPSHCNQTLILRVRIPSKQVNLPRKGVTQAPKNTSLIQIVVKPRKIETPRHHNEQGHKFWAELIIN